MNGQIGQKANCDQKTFQPTRPRFTRTLVGKAGGIGLELGELLIKIESTDHLKKQGLLFILLACILKASGINGPKVLTGQMIFHAVFDNTHQVFHRDGKMSGTVVL